MAQVLRRQAQTQLYSAKTSTKCPKESSWIKSILKQLSTLQTRTQWEHTLFLSISAFFSLWWKSTLNTLWKLGFKTTSGLKQQETTQLNATKSRLTAIDKAIAQLDENKGLSLITSFVAESENFDHFITVQADMKTRKNVAIFPEFAGRLLRFYVKEGQQVKKGTLLASIDDGGLQQQLEQLKLQLELAKTTFERSQRLWDQKIGTEIQYLEAKTRYESQEQQVSQMKEQLAKTKVYAPFSGTVDELLANEGANLLQEPPQFYVS